MSTIVADGGGGGGERRDWHVEYAIRQIADAHVNAENAKRLFVVERDVEKARGREEMREAVDELCFGRAAVQAGEEGELPDFGRLEGFEKSTRRGAHCGYLSFFCSTRQTFEMQCFEIWFFLVPLAFFSDDGRFYFFFFATTYVSFQ